MPASRTRPPLGGWAGTSATTDPPKPTSFIVDAINLARPNLNNIVAGAVFLAYWVSGTASCTMFLTTLLASMKVTAALSVSVGVTVLFWVATWARYTRRGQVRDAGGFVMAAVQGVWLLAGVSHPDGPYPFYAFTVAVSVVGCMSLSNMIVITALEERRTGSRTGHSLYRFYDARGKLLYIGITNSIRLRFAQHKDSKSWWPQVAVREISHYPSRAAVLAAERAAIIRERPIYNVQHNSNNRRRRVA